MHVPVAETGTKNVGMRARKPWPPSCKVVPKKKDEKQLEAVNKIMHTKKLEPPLLKFHLYFYG